MDVRGKPVQTGFFKSPTSGRVGVHPAGLAGDSRVEERKFGDEGHAVYVFPLEHYAYWEDWLGVEPFEPGQFGENLTVNGLTETTVRIGDVWRVGTAVLQVTSPRIPCRKLNARMGFKFAKTFLESRRIGFYLRVLEPGELGAGDAVEVVSSDPASPTMDEFIRISQFDYWDVEGLKFLLQGRDLMPGWREALEDKRARARSAEGWFGLRELEVFDRWEETQDVTSLFLRCPYGRPLAEFQGGQYLTVAVTPAAGQPTARRSYAVSSAPRDKNFYRITVLARRAEDGQGPAGVVSNFIHKELAVGRRLKVAAPRGFCNLDARSGDARRLVFISGGIGCAPVVSMLGQWARDLPDIPAHFISVYDDGRQHALRSDVLQIKNRRGDLTTEVVYREPRAGDRLGDDYDLAGELSGDALGAAARPEGTDVYIVGPSRFVDGIRDALLGAGVDAGRLHEERFGA